MPWRGALTTSYPTISVRSCIPMFKGLGLSLTLIIAGMLGAPVLILAFT